MADNKFAPVEAIASLTDPTRRALYEHVGRQARAVGRDEAAAAVGVSRSLAAYHLDRLVESGLLRARFARPEGRGGPGAGRPAKLYERPARAVEVSVPSRNYQLAARAFAEVLAPDLNEEARSALRSASRRLGGSMVLGASESGAGNDLVARLEGMGYQPYREGNKVRLRNCLFADLTRHHRDLTCSMNLGLIEGALDALGEDPSRARLDPRDQGCCVAIAVERCVADGAEQDAASGQAST